MNFEAYTLYICTERHLTTYFYVICRVDECGCAHAVAEDVHKLTSIVCHVIGNARPSPQFSACVVATLHVQLFFDEILIIAKS